MHARLTRFSVPSDSVDDFVRAFEGRSADAPATAPAEAFLLVDRSAGSAVSLSLWDDEAAMARGREAGAESRQRAVDAASASISGTEEFEVAMHMREGQLAATR